MGEGLHRRSGRQGHSRSGLNELVAAFGWRADLRVRRGSTFAKTSADRSAGASPSIWSKSVAALLLEGGATCDHRGGSEPHPSDSRTKGDAGFRTCGIIRRRYENPQQGRAKKPLKIP